MDCCPICFEYCEKVPDCLGELQVNINLNDTPVTVQIFDKFNNIYEWEAYSASTGFVVLDLDRPDLPPSLLNPWAGKFKLKIIDNGEVVPFVISGDEFDCLVFEVGNYSAEKDSYIIDVYGTAQNNGIY